MNPVQQKSIKYSRTLYIVISILFSLIATYVCSSDANVPDCYRQLYLLPLFHAVILLIFAPFAFAGDLFNDLPAMIMSLIMLVRNALTPMVMATETYVSKLGIPNSYDSVNKAITLFIYETAIIFFIMAVEKSRKEREKTIRFRLGVEKNKNIFFGLVLFGVFFSILAFLVLPELRTQFYTIFTSDFIHLEKETLDYGFGIKRAIATASNMIIEATRMVVSAVIIVYLRKKGERPMNYFLSICVILVQFLFINDSNAYIIMVSLALYLLLYKLFPKYGKKTLRYLFIVVIAYGVLMYLNRFSTDMYGNSLSLFLQAYFPSIANFTGIEYLMDRSTVDAVKQIFIDLYAAVPFRTTLFGYDGNLVELPTMWQKTNNVVGQILPNIAQSYYYFGSFLSPVLSIIIAKGAFVVFRNLKKETSPYMYVVYAYVAIYMSVSVFMYNFFIFTTALLTRIMFMAIFSYFSQTTFEDVFGEEKTQE